MNLAVLLKNEETAESTAEAKELYLEAVTSIGGTGFHFCDVRDVPLGLGDWYHKRGEEYDLCTKEYEKLSDDERLQFVKIDTPEELVEEWATFGL